MNTWIIEPNWLAWTLLILLTMSLVSIAICLWCRKHKDNIIDKYNILAWISIIIGIIALIAVFFRESNENNASLLIAALGVLVTLLVGWQIYKSIETGKLLNRLIDLENKFNAANDALAAQDMRNIELIEAFECKRQADLYQEETLISRLTVRYTALLLAIKHFLNADMLYDYRPLKDTVDKLGNVLGNIENLNQVDRSQFNRYRERLENIYDEIIIAIDRRLDEYQEIKRLIKQYHDRRIVIHQS